MPHRVHGFFNPQSILPAYFHEHTNPPQRLSNERPHLGDRSASISSASSQDSHDRAAKMVDLNLKKRLSQMAPKLRKVGSRASLDQRIPAKLGITMESPPVVYIGQPQWSSGALISGQLRLYITEPSMNIADFRMKLSLDTTRKRPFSQNCPDCTSESRELTSWNFLQASLKLRKGEHCFPFSYLLKGDLPAAMKGPLSKIQYILQAVITSKEGEKITLDYTLPVKRAIPASEYPKQSIRIFPPTILTCDVELPSVIYPIGEAMCKLKLNGIITKVEGSKTQHQWKVKRMTWRIEETHKVISPACPKHAAKIVSRGGLDIKVANELTDVQPIGSGELQSGWKSDWDEGFVEIEFPFHITSSDATCDLSDTDGTDVSHQLIIELIVAEEHAPERKPQQSTPTGGARILRMHFNIVVTERAGMGISWDEEQPPIYENVPASPPGYVMADIRDYTGSPLIDSDPLPPVPDYELLP